MHILNDAIIFSPVLNFITGDFLFVTAGMLGSDTQHLPAIPFTVNVTIEFPNKT